MDLALKRIKENKRTRSPVLSLNGCGLKNELPEKLFECTWLEKLSLGIPVGADEFGWTYKNSMDPGYTDNIFKGPGELAPLKKLPNLKELSCVGCYIEDIEFARELTGLKKMYLWRNKINNLQPLEGLDELEST